MNPDFNNDVMFRELLEAIPDTIFIVNHEGKIILVNGQVENMFGYKKEEIVGQLIEIFVPVRFRGPHVEKRAHYLEKPYTRRMGSGLELYALHKDGREFPVDISLTPFMIKGQMHVISSVRDISDIKQAQQKILQNVIDIERSRAEREQLELFAYVVSHDLQLPFQNILALNELLELNCGKLLDKKGLDYLERIKNATLRMSRLISDLLHFQKMTKRELDFDIVDLNMVMRDVVQDLEAQITKSKAQICIDELPQVFASKIHMHELFINLVSNALKYSKANEIPRIDISGTELPDGFSQITVRDNGVGFETEEAENIFKPFMRLRKEPEYSGTGMGLTICQRIVIENGGKITAESKPGAGTSFIVTLPSKPQ